MMENTTIIAPSYKRANGLKTHLLFPEVTYLVMESELDAYKDKHDKFITCPDKVQGNIARVRNFILDTVKTDRVLIVDDDIEKFCYFVRDDIARRWIVNSMEGAKLLNFIENGFNLCEEWGAKLWGLNCVGDKGSYREYTPFSTIAFISASFHGIIKNPLRYDERIPLKEDYDYCLQHMNKYRMAIRFNMAHMVKQDHGNLGGCADYRTIEREREQLLMFQKKWGEKIVKTDIMKSEGKKGAFDLNPIIKPPIKGV